MTVSAFSESYSVIYYHLCSLVSKTVLRVNWFRNKEDFVMCSQRFFVVMIFDSISNK